MLRWSQVLALSACLCSASATWADSSAESLSAQERLDAIRHSLVEKALQGSTQVQSTQWIDSRGQLRDLSSFRSGMEVRAVKVLSYSRDSEGMAKAQLLSPPPKDLPRHQEKTVKADQDSCPSPESLRHVVALNMVFERGITPSIQQQIRQQIANEWLSSPHESWRMIERNQFAPAFTSGSTPGTYEQALTTSDAARVPWSATVKMQAEFEELNAWEKFAGRTPHHAKFKVELKLVGMNGQAKSFQASKIMSLPLVRNDWASKRLDEVGSAQLQQLLTLWSERLGQWMACDPLLAQVTPSLQNQIQINAGALAGVKPGDEWLLADPQTFPSQVVGPSSDSLILAKVVTVAAHHAQLAVLAGPVQALAAHWRAWPTQTLAQEH